MPNPLNRGVLGGPLTPVYIAGAEAGSMAGEGDAVTIVSISVPATAPLVGQAIIAVAGTAVQLSPHNIPLPGGVVLITGRVAATYVTAGGVGVADDADGAGNGATIAVGETIAIFASHINQVYINGAVGDWVSLSAG